LFQIVDAIQGQIKRDIKKLKKECSYLENSSEIVSKHLDILKKRDEKFRDKTDAQSKEQ
jgi:hypothetical protein